MLKLLFVCKGNICRSPTAEGVFRQRVAEAGLDQQIKIDSAGTHNCHLGKQPDERAQAVAKKRGFDLSGIRARWLQARDFEEFDYILTMDSKNLACIHLDHPEQRLDKAGLFLGYAKTHLEKDVPDPYYGDHDGFERVLNIVERSADELLAYLVDKHELQPCTS